MFIASCFVARLPFTLIRWKPEQKITTYPSARIILFNFKRHPQIGLICICSSDKPSVAIVAKSVTVTKTRKQQTARIGNMKIALKPILKMNLWLFFYCCLPIDPITWWEYSTLILSTVVHCNLRVNGFFTASIEIESRRNMRFVSGLKPTTFEFIVLYVTWKSALFILLL